MKNFPVIPRCAIIVKSLFKDIHITFVNEYNIPEQLITLHYWASFSYKYFKHITGWDWAEKNYHTLFGKIMSRIYSNEH